MKKAYIIPSNKVHQISATRMIAESNFGPVQSNFDGEGNGVTDVNSSALGREDNSSNNVWSNEW